MPRTIRKHPIAFIHSLAWFVLGLMMIYVAQHMEDSYEQAPYAVVVVIVGTACAVLIPLTALIGIILLLVRRGDAAARTEKKFLKEAAVRYANTSNAVSAVRYQLAIAALALPVFLPVFLLLCFPSLENYAATILFCSIGLTVWLWSLFVSLPHNLLAKHQTDTSVFQINRGLTEFQFEEIRKESSVLGIPKHLWDGRKGYLYNMLLREKLMDDRTTIACCEFSLAQLYEKLQLPAPKDEEVLWVRLDPLLRNQWTPGIGAIKSLFSYSLSAIKNSRYENNTSTDEADYEHRSDRIQLDMDEEAQLVFSEGRPYLLCPQAYSLDENDDKLYLGCMLQIEGAHLERVMYDHFHTWTDPDATTEYDLSPEERDTFYRLLREDVFSCTVQTIDYHPFDNQLAINVWGEPVDDGQEQPFFLDDGSEYAVILRYSRLIWHWMETDSMD